MVAETAVKPDTGSTFPQLTRETAADPRTFSRIAEAVAAESVRAKSKIKALDATRMMEILDSVCFDLTRRHLHQANEVEDSPLETFRRVMFEGEIEVEAVRLSMGIITQHWKRVEKEFGDAAPVIPPRKHYVEASGGRNERFLRTAEGYLDKLIAIVNDMLAGDTQSLDAQRKLETIKRGCLMLTGEQLGDVADRWTDPIRRFRGPLQTPGEELTVLRKAYWALPGPTFKERTRWDKIIETVRQLQWAARHDPAKFMAYVFRDADPSHANEVLELEWFHVSWFGVWLDPNKPNSLIMAPPGHGKSFCICAMDIFEAANKPELRFLVLYDKADKTGKEIMRIEGIMQSDLFRAVFPKIRIMDRSGKRMVEGAHGKKKRKATRRHALTQYAFTIGRVNDLFSREATFEGAGVLSNINGDGFDRIRADDFSPPQCREEPYQRIRYHNRFTNVVEERLRDAADSRIRVIHTPWHPDDAPGQIRKAVKKGQLPTWRSQVEPYAIKDDEHGKAIPLWEAKKDSAALEERKFRSSLSYDCCYRLQATDQGRRALEKVMWYNSVDNDLANDSDRALWDDLAEAHRTLSIDPAASDERTASDTGAVDGRITLPGYGFVPHVWLLHFRPMQLLEWIVKQIIHAWKNEKQPYDEILIEAQGGIKGMTSLFEDWLPKEFEKLEMPQALWPSILTPGTRIGQGNRGQNRGKMRRLREAAPYLERGCVRLAGRRERGPGGVIYGLAPIPGSPMATLATLLKEFDGTTPFDGGDALDQWILKNKDRLQDPNAIKPPTHRRAAKRLGPMATAMSGVLSRLTKPPVEDSTITGDIAKTFGKYAANLEKGIQR